MNIKLIIFDLDGTLLYTLGDIADSTNNILKKLDLPEIPEQEYKKLVGHGLKEVLKRAVLSFDIPGSDFEAAYLSLLEDYNVNCLKRTCFYDGIVQLLDKLVSMEIKISILSNKENELVQIITDELMKPWNFVSIQGTKPEIKKKPDQEAVLKILDEVNVKPSEAIFIGDSGVDMKTAVNSGLVGVGVTWGYRDIIELTEAGAGIVIDKPEELLRILDSEQ